MMSRTQVTLEPEMHKSARRRAGDLGISLAEYLRRLLQKDLGTDRKDRVDVSCIFDLGRSAGPTNVAKEKDRMIAEAIDADFERSRGR
jgi:hypothetical protein